MASPGAEMDDLTKPIGNVEEKWKLLPHFIRMRGLMKQHIDSFNHFIDVEMKNIVMARSNYEIRSEADPNYFVQYIDIRTEMPSIPDEFEISKDQTNPFQCRLRDCTYSAPILADFRYMRTQQDNGESSTKVVSRKNVQIGRIPIMLRSNKCVLSNRSEKELAEMQECLYDPGGYFVIKGVEKVILMHEQLSKNRVIIELDPKDNISASITSSTHERKSRCNIFFKNQKVYLKHNSLGDDIPIVIVLKAMGLESDQEIVQLVGTELEIQDLFANSIEEPYILGIKTQQDALAYIGTRVRNVRNNNANTRNGYRFNGNQNSNTLEVDAIEILANVVLNHVPVTEYNFRLKVIYVTHIVRRVLNAVHDRSLLDDKDYYGNKRLELAGSLISLLFEDLLKRFNNDLKRQMDVVLSKPTSSKVRSHFDPTKMIKQDTITQGFVHAISTGSWVLKRFRMDRAGVTQVLSRLSYISALGMMTRVSSQFEKTRKVSGPRSLQTSQWGMMCPADTPEGEACGLVKNLALLAHVTNDEEYEDSNLRRVCFDLGVEDVTMLSGHEINNEKIYLVFINGLIIGTHSNPQYLVKRVRELRRMARVGEFVSVYLNELQKAVYIASDGGRVCRPLLVLHNNGTPKLTDEHITKLNAKEDPLQLEDLIQKGIIEYVDVNEENNCLIALNETHLTPDHTHMEIDPMTILGVVCGLVPYPHHNQSPRNTYQCAMGKQAIGTIGLNQYERFDSLLYTMVYPQKPIVKTKVLDLINFDQLPGGQNASMVVMSYSGYDIEDAVVLNRGSLDRGFGRCIVIKKYSTVVKKYANDTVDETFGRKEADSFPNKENDVRYKRQQFIDVDGMCMVGEKLDPNHILVNKATPPPETIDNSSTLGRIKKDSDGNQNGLDSGDGRVKSNEGGVEVGKESAAATQTNSTSTDSVNVDAKKKDFKRTPLVYKGAGSATVDKVLLTSNEHESLIVKVLLRQVRRPEVGDKFSSRHGQKGVCGLIVNHEDMPFSDRGIVPDIIMNPHGFPSRMTVGKMIEIVAGKAAVYEGRQAYGSAFGEENGSADKVADVCKVLVQHGFNYNGKDLFTSGTTGEPIRGYVFAGPVFYQKLKHMVIDKMHARAKGPRAVLTRQPTEGRSRDGGLRLGEMVRIPTYFPVTSNLIKNISSNNRISSSLLFIFYLLFKIGTRLSHWLRRCQFDHGKTHDLFRCFHCQCVRELRTPGLRWLVPTLPQW